MTNANMATERYQKLSQIYQHFCNRFSAEYLSALRGKHGWTGSGVTANKIKEGDIVLIHSDQKKRLSGKWP